MINYLNLPQVEGGLSLFQHPWQVLILPCSLYLPPILTHEDPHRDVHSFVGLAFLPPVMYCKLDVP